MSLGPVSRRAVLATAAVTGLSGLAACVSPAPASNGTPEDQRTSGTPQPVRHHYGSGPQQFGDLYRPRSGTPRGTVVVIHGGFWQSGYALNLGAATSADLARRGWTAWNIEYRRLGDGGGWPTTFADVAAAVDHLTRLPEVDTDRVTALGHSAGGQLAAWVASRRDASLPGGAAKVQVAAVVAQAGVLALAVAASTGLGGTAVPDLVGGMPSRLPHRYAEVDPIERLPLGVPIRCVHGAGDTTVPLSQSTAYVDAAKAAGADAELVKVPGDHFALIDPSTAAWQQTLGVLTALGPR